MKILKSILHLLFEGSMFVLWFLSDKIEELWEANLVGLDLDPCDRDR